MSFSLYPNQVQLLADRERELNLHRSVCIQVLLDIEASKGLLRAELIRRLAPPTAAVETKGQ